MTLKVSKSMLFRVCVYPSPDRPKQYVAHCLELDLLGEGATPKDAIAELIQAIELQIEACNDESQFFFPAPAHVWRKYSQGKATGRAILGRIVRQAIKQASPLYTPRFESVVATPPVPDEYLDLAAV